MNILKYMKLNWNETLGFTLLEAIVSLLVSSFTLLLVIGSLNQIKVMNDSTMMQSQPAASVKEYVISDRQIEWHLFLNQLNNQLQNSKFIELSNNQLIILEWDEALKREVKVYYNQAKTGKKNFRRSKNNGNHTLLTNLQKYKMTKNEGWLYLDFTFKNGQNYKAKLWIESWVDLNDEEN